MICWQSGRCKLKPCHLILNMLNCVYVVFQRCRSRSWSIMYYARVQRQKDYGKIIQYPRFTSTLILMVELIKNCNSSLTVAYTLVYQGWMLFLLLTWLKLTRLTCFSFHSIYIVIHFAIDVIPCKSFFSVSFMFFSVSCLF